MLLTKIQARDFLSFDQLDMEVGPALTVVTGPNGVGKTNLGRCIDVVRVVLAHNVNPTQGDRLEVYQSAGRHGSGSFRVALGLTLDQQWERDLVRSFVQAAFACGRLPSNGPSQMTPADLDTLVRTLLIEDSLAPLWSGTLQLHYDAGWRNPWFAAWEFQHDRRTWHLCLVGSGAGQLRAGEAEAVMIPAGAVLDLTQRLAPAQDPNAQASPATDALAPDEMDLRTALPGPGEAMSVRISSPTDMSSPVPASLRELATGLDVLDFDNRSFEFVHVMWEVVRRGVVLTDNRRVPFKRRFTPADLDRPLDLRDGGNVPARLYLLRNGSAPQQRRYDEITDTFERLTGQQLGLRARHEPPHVSKDGATIIEPTVVSDRGEHLVEFSGAGVQEALGLSTLLPGEPGRLFVLDEPAVNLAPTVQRRLTATLRGAGRCLVITHSPDMVPIDQPHDLGNIVRLAPTTEGPNVLRAGTFDRKAWSRWVSLLEPTHVRALLFAEKVILCEGSTEVGALQRWWSHPARPGLPSPEEANIPIISVGGDSGFGAYIEYLDAFGVPWAIVTDGPALRPTSKLAKQLRNHKHLPAPEPGSEDDFERWRTYWQSAGVFSFADQFGDDGTKAGEFEALLNRVDAVSLAKVQGVVGVSKKPQVGTLFAAEHPTPPSEVLALYESIMRWFGFPPPAQQTTTAPHT